MKTKIKCPCCEEEYSVDKSLIGELVKCENCGTTFTASRTAPISPLQNDSSRNQTPFLPQDPVENPLSEYSRTGGLLGWIKAFFDFKVMITPSFVRISFFLVFVSGMLVILVWPFKMGFMRYVEWYDFSKILGYLVMVLIEIPVFAFVLHVVYELTMIPFSILNTLLEIRNRLDEKNSVTGKSVLTCIEEIRDKMDEKSFVTSKSILQCLLEIRDKMDEKNKELNTTKD